MNQLLSPYQKGNFELKNHIIMSPMTRSRAIDNIPNPLMAQYYGQRTGAGLIITEGTAPTPEALGYPRIPGIFNKEQTDGWKLITDTVHQGNSKIFLQLMHTGRIGHEDNLPEGITLAGVSDKKASGDIFTDTKGPQPHSTPVKLSMEGIEKVISGFAAAAKNAVAAGFDGVEIHGANGYLLEQFFNPHVNNREDKYGGSVENRIQFAVEVVEAVANAIGKEKMGIRLSPFSKLGDLAEYDAKEVSQTYSLLSRKLNELGITYLHIAVNAPVPQALFEAIRNNFEHTIILANDLTPETAEQALKEGFADVVGFGRSFLANPDFVNRIIKKAELNPVDYSSLYTPGATGYTDYPVMAG